MVLSVHAVSDRNADGSLVAGAPVGGGEGAAVGATYGVGREVGAGERVAAAEDRTVAAEEHTWHEEGQRAVSVSISASENPMIHISVQVLPANSWHGWS